MKQTKFQKLKQKGFTLLELLVVITLLAILSVGALVAYEGIGENAQNVGAANNIALADSSIRSYAAVENVYPNQWDNLVNADNGGVNRLVAPETRAFIASLDLAAVNTANATVAASIANAMVNAGLTEFQSLLSTAVISEDAIPNEVWNESATGVTVPADELEVDYTPSSTTNPTADAVFPANSDISVFASGGDAGTCTVGGVSIATNKAATPTTLQDSAALNRINDVLDAQACHLVLAVGFGKDVPGTTLNSKVAISTAPTYVSDRINPSENYARYIALFHIGSGDDDGATPGVVTEFRNKAKLIGIVDTEGRAIDQSISGAFEEENE